MHALRSKKLLMHVDLTTLVHTLHRITCLFYSSKWHVHAKLKTINLVINQNHSYPNRIKNLALSSDYTIFLCSCCSALHVAWSFKFNSTQCVIFRAARPCIINIIMLAVITVAIILICIPLPSVLMHWCAED